MRGPNPAGKIVKFLMIRAEQVRAELEEHEDVPSALRALGLRQGEIDHGTVSQHLGIMVYEYGFLRPIEEQRLFSIWGQLYCGNALVYRIDARGETMSMCRASVPPVVFYASVQEVERVIRAGLVRRPYMAFNDLVTWEWNK